MNAFDEYQKFTNRTAKYKKSNKVLHLAYLVAALASEAGEVADEYKKSIRDDRDDGINLTPERDNNIAKELGDVLYYVAQIAEDRGFKLSDIAEMNKGKLTERYGLEQTPDDAIKAAKNLY